MTKPIDDALVQLSPSELAVAEALFQAYTPYLRAIVRRQLSDRLRCKFDPSDVVQSVWVQVVRQLGTDGWPVANEDQIRGLLATIARRRLISRIRKDDPGVAVQTFEGNDSEDVSQNRYPRASEIAQADEMWQKMLEICPPEHHAILKLRREGLLLHEIAERTGLHEGSVRRILRRIAQELALRQQPIAANTDSGSASTPDPSSSIP